MKARLLLCLGLIAGCGDDGQVPAADGAPPDATTACDPDAQGTICTIVGNGVSGYDGDEAIVALDAKMSLPQDTLAGPDGKLYVLDWNNHRVRVLTPDGMLRHVAGRGELGGTLDDPANSDFNHPTSLLLSPDGNSLLIAAWHNSKIRTIALGSGDITDTCGDGRRAYFGDGMAAMTSSLDLPTSIVFDPAGDLVIMDQANQVIRKIDASGNIDRIAGQCVIDQTVQCAPGVDPVPCPAPSGKFTCGVPADECSKPCNPSYSVGTGALDFRMAQPFGQSADPGGRMVYDAAGNLYFADTANHLIRRLTTAGAVEVVVGVEPIGGLPQQGTSPDGTLATETLLNRPTDLTLSDDGELYFSDVYNHCVRKLAGDGKVYTVAGKCGEKGFEGDGGAPTDALLKLPYGIELAGSKLYVTDTGNMRVRVVNL